MAVSAARLAALSGAPVIDLAPSLAGAISTYGASLTQTLMSGDLCTFVASTKKYQREA
jgi:hypothetical protein